MSTYWGYVCKSHDPHLSSEHWFNHGEDTLRETFYRERAGFWPDDQRFPELQDPVPVVHRTYATTGPIHWLRQHPRCNVWLENEYGDTRPIGGPA